MKNEEGKCKELKVERAEREGGENGGEGRDKKRKKNYNTNSRVLGNSRQ